jgi:hypothetical protein
MNDRFFTMGIMLLFITIGVNTMVTMGSQLKDTNDVSLQVYFLPYIFPNLADDIRTKVNTCNTNANQLTPQATAPGSTEGFTPIVCKDSGGVDIAGGISFLTNAIFMLAGLEAILIILGTFMFPLAYPIFLGFAAIVALLKWGLIAYAASQIVRALFGRSFF